MYERTIVIRTKISCCLDGDPYIPLEEYRPFNHKELKTQFSTTLEEWGKIMEDISAVLTTYKATIQKCHPISTSFYACNYEGIVTSLTETTTIITVTFQELEELIYDTYLKQYKVRLIPTNVTDAISYMQEYGVPRAEKIPKPGIDIERYCSGYWCFDTIAHSTKFNKMYPRVADILSKIEVEVI